MRDETEGRVLEIVQEFSRRLPEAGQMEASQLLWETVGRILDLDELADVLSERDVTDALMQAPSLLRKDLQDATEAELRDYISKFLVKIREYTAVFPLRDVYDFPPGLPIGSGEFVAFDDLPDRVKTSLENSWRWEFKRNPGFYKEEEELLRDRKKSSIVEIRVRAVGPQKALELGKQKAEDSLNILRSLFDHEVPIETYAVYSGDRGLFSLHGSWRTTTYHAELDDTIRFFSEIITKVQPNDLESRLRTALRLYGLTKTIDRPEIEFVLLVVGLESMLLGKGDKDYLRQRLSEKSAFLLEDGEEERIRLYKRVRTLYDKRSRFVHEGPEIITSDDVDDADGMFLRVFNRLRELLKDGYVSVPMVNEKKTIDRLIQKLRFR